MRTVPTAAVPNQRFSLVLGGLNVSVTLRSLAESLYADVVCEGVPIADGRICLDRQIFTSRAATLGFPSLRLMFADLRGATAPHWSGLGSRYVLVNRA